MFQAQYLPVNTVVYTPWFARGGDLMRASAELVARSASETVTITPFTKADTDAGDGAAATGTLTLSSVGRQTAEFSNLKNLVRYKIDPGATGSWVMVRILPPSWFEKVV